MLHDLSPFVIRFSENFGARWYGFSYVIGFVSAYLLIHWLVRRQRAGLTSDQVGDFITFAAFGTLIGGRLGYVLFYAPDLLWKFKIDFPFWGVLALNEGGMSAHGGILGVTLACLLFASRRGLSPLYLFDLCAVSAPIGIFFGRVANFLNGELVGRPAPADFPLAVRFPHDIRGWLSNDFERLKTLEPVVTASGGDGAGWLTLLSEDRANPDVFNRIDDMLLGLIHHVQNGNEAVKAAITPLLDPRHPSQLYAAAGEGILLFLILFILWRSPRKPGFIAACFGVFYAIIRWSDEFFRMPDADIGFGLLGLTRGQWLSIGMLILGLFLMLIWTRSVSTTTSGWGRVRSVRLGRRS